MLNLDEMEAQMKKNIIQYVTWQNLILSHVTSLLLYIYIFIYWILIGAKSAPFKKVGNMWFPTLTLIPIAWLKAHGNNLSKPLLNSVHCFLVFWFSLSSLYFLVFLLLGFLFCCIFLSFLTSSVLPFIACWHWKRKFLTVTTKRY